MFQLTVVGAFFCLPSLIVLLFQFAVKLLNQATSLIIQWTQPIIVAHSACLMQENPAPMRTELLCTVTQMAPPVLLGTFVVQDMMMAVRSAAIFLVNSTDY